MINPVSIIALAFLVTLLAVMYYFWVADGYEAPENVRHAIIRNLRYLLGVFLGASAMNVVLHGLQLREWDFDLFIGFAIGVGVLILIDFIVLARRDKSKPL